MKRTFYSFSDRHSHPREGDLQMMILPFNNYYHNVLCIPNLKDSVDTPEKFTRHEQEVRRKLPYFIPTFGIMATENTTPEIVRESHSRGARFIKLIPGKASTNSTTGISLHEIERLYPSFREAHKLDMPGLFHFELPFTKNGDPIAPIDQEEAAIPYAEKVVRDFPDWLISIEHPSTQQMIQFIEEASDNVIGIPTVHHATRTHKDAKDNPFLHCKPVLKTEEDCIAVRKAMVSGNYKKFRFGTDNAAHFPETKLSGIPGIYMPAPIAIPLLYQIFKEEDALDNIEGFACANETDRKFYGWDFPYDSTFSIIDEEWIVPSDINGIVPFMAGEKMKYKIAA